MGYVAAFFIGAFLGAMSVIMWALAVASKRDRKDD